MIDKNIQVAQSKRTAFAKLAGALPAIALTGIGAIVKWLGFFNADWSIVCFPLLLFIGHTVLFRIVYRASTLALIDVDTAIALYDEAHENDPEVGVQEAPDADSTKWLPGQWNSRGVCYRLTPGTCAPCACATPCEHDLGYAPILPPKGYCQHFRLAVTCPHCERRKNA